MTMSTRSFTSHFLARRGKSSGLAYIAVDPGVVRRVVGDSTRGSSRVLRVVSGLGDVRVLATGIGKRRCCSRTLGIMRGGSKEFRPFLSFGSNARGYRVVIQGGGSAVVRLIVLVRKGGGFSIVGFANGVDSRFVSGLTTSVGPGHS